MPKEALTIGLIALAGILVGGVYSTWKTAKLMAGILLVLALLAAGGAVAWYVSS
ncbi:hypothetical protein V5P93_005386 [Actinokineospora auranticolor]|uniref:Uncharacterized protein n=1 Tax=Actinokineospora auranticolor TaxID=155976 RepID=A0A2S6GQX9_9PSEU|nr:hypothetical protein [Actinokineospora auranticolor]PPK67587.1 hypothetical protein CLV40_107253 [Actinokineospora auranticolor]